VKLSWSIQFVHSRRLGDTGERRRDRHRAGGVLLIDPVQLKSPEKVRLLTGTQRVMTPTCRCPKSGLQVPASAQGGHDGAAADQTLAMPL
jgi:hypothetical protein